MRKIRLCLLASLASLASLSGLLLSATPPERMAIVDISSAGPSNLNILKKLGGISWWTEMGGSLIVSANARGFANMDSTGFVARVLPDLTTADDLRVLIAGHSSMALPAGVNTLADEGRARLVRGDSAALSALDQSNVDHGIHVGVFPVEPGKVILRSATNQDVPRRVSQRESFMVNDVARKVSKDRWWADVRKLAAWNRHISATGNIEARDWIKMNLAAIPGMEVTLQEFRVAGRSAWNVVGILPGERMVDDSGSASANDRGLVIVGGHFDSTSERASYAAPGAEDNASGAAGVIELARVMADVPHSEDIVFAAFSGEEQGLYGSAAFVEKLVEGLPEQETSRVRGVITMDMIGYSRSGTSGQPGVIIETESQYSDFARRFVEAAAEVTNLRVTTSFNPFGSDHVSFLDAGIPAILAIDADWNHYAHYHKTTDTPDKLTPELAYEILKMNAAVTALLAR
ncbi:Zn-dependent exopeptidase M28 [bacterium]|nr:Zn-dependent exopeptidase M28 [bacterium]